MRLSLEIRTLVSADAVISAEGNTRLPMIAGGCLGSPGSKSLACTRVDSPGTWEALPSPGQRTGQGSGTEKPGGKDAPFDPAKILGAPWYHGAKETKRRGMDGKESDRATVPTSMGNRTVGTHGRERLDGTRSRCEER